MIEGAGGVEVPKALFYGSAEGILQGVFIAKRLRFWSPCDQK